MTTSPTAMSSCEVELNAATVATMASKHCKMIVMEILHGDPDSPFTMPLLTDGSSALAVMTNEQNTKRTRHIERRAMYCKEANFKSKIGPSHIGTDFQLGDPGTKNQTAEESEYLLRVTEGPSPISLVILPASNSANYARRRVFPYYTKYDSQYCPHRY